MPTRKARLTKSVALLTQEVVDVTALSKSQRQNADMLYQNADSQHVIAHKLEVLGAALDATAEELKGELKKL